MNYVEPNILEYSQEMSSRDAYFLKLEFQRNCFFDFHEIQNMLFKYEFKEVHILQGCQNVSLKQSSAVVGLRNFVAFFFAVLGPRMQRSF